MRGYLAISIQHDLPTDAPMVTKSASTSAGSRSTVQYSISVNECTGAARRNSPGPAVGRHRAAAARRRRPRAIVVEPVGHPSGCIRAGWYRRAAGATGKQAHTCPQRASGLKKRLQRVYSASTVNVKATRSLPASSSLILPQPCAGGSDVFATGLLSHVDRHQQGGAREPWTNSTSIGQLIPASTSTFGRLMQEIARLEGVRRTCR